MTFFCFIESQILSTPHMEPLAADSAEGAMAEAQRLMALHASAIAAHVFQGATRVGTIMPEAAAA